MTSKAELRETALARRAALGETARASASEAACGHLSELVRPGETVALFYPMRDEIDTRRLASHVRQSGGTVLLPAVVGGNIEFRRHDPSVPLETGTFGTSHPPADAGTALPDLIVAPLAAFDRAGNRIGYGGGYYDKFTAALDEAGHAFRFVGIAFACQEVDAVPAEPHDRRLDAVVTENGLISFTEPQ
jgi:5-formyltetrahydrofolate cyclo-ligase